MVDTMSLSFTVPMNIPTLLPIPLYLSMITYYLVLAPSFKTEKQRAYILSTLSSGLMTSASLPFIWTYGRKGLGGLYETGGEGWMGKLAEAGVVFFAVYLFGESALLPIHPELLKGGS